MRRNIARSRRRDRHHAAPRSETRVFAALGDDTRLHLIDRLCDSGPASITTLAADAQVSRQAIAKHVRVMERAGLVRSSRHGRERVCELNRQRLVDARHYLDIISRQWDDALGRLRALVED
jgi:DNA-binding transcriptional ArsR family regulator